MGSPKLNSDPFSAPKAPKILKNLPFFGVKTLFLHDCGGFLSKSDTNWQNLAKSKSYTTPSHPLSNRSLIVTYQYIC